jgi:hypothetical protein
VLREHRQILREVHVGEHFQDQVDAVAFREVHQLLEVASVVMIEGVMRTLLLDEHAPRARSRRCR